MAVSTERRWRGHTYAALELTDEHGSEKRTGVLRVSNILESLGGVLAGLGDQNLVTARVLLSVDCVRKERADS